MDYTLVKDCKALERSFDLIIILSASALLLSSVLIVLLLSLV